MEYLDVVDKHGNPTGVKKSRADVHRDGDWHKTIHLWIINSNQELLIQKRSAQKDTCPNRWDVSVAGHIQAGDAPVTASQKEISEELGIETPNRSPEFLFSYAEQTVHKDGTYINNSIHDVFLLELEIDLATVKLQEEEVSEIKWIDFRELEKEITTEPEKFAPHPEEYARLFSALRKRYERSKGN